jgi:hypothetical protein
MAARTSRDAIHQDDELGDGGVGTKNGRLITARFFACNKVKEYPLRSTRIEILRVFSFANRHGETLYLNWLLIFGRG